jgi:hypothetical protein
MKETIATQFQILSDKLIKALTEANDTKNQINLELTKNIIRAYDKYINLLSDELNEVCGIAYAHGWESNRSDLGDKAREEIDIAIKNLFKGKII